MTQFTQKNALDNELETQHTCIHVHQQIQNCICTYMYTYSLSTTINILSVVLVFPCFMCSTQASCSRRRKVVSNVSFCQTHSGHTSMWRRALLSLSRYSKLQREKVSKDTLQCATQLGSSPGSRTCIHVRSPVHLFIRLSCIALPIYTWICSQPTELPWWFSG